MLKRCEDTNLSLKTGKRSHFMNLNIEIRDKKGAENLAADHLSRLENPHQDKLENKEINEAFPLETLGSIALQDQSTPWFADFANYHAGKFVIKGMTSQQKNKFFKDVKHYFWDGSGPTGGHYGWPITTAQGKIIDSRILLAPSPIYRGARMTLSTPCDILSRHGKILQRDEDCTKLHSKFAKSLTSGALIYGPFPVFRWNKYILEGC
ncbi:hypothetical protein Tco_0967758 [Tanacetum coccineum]